MSSKCDGYTQRRNLTILLLMIRLLPPANEVWGKVIFLHLFVILFTGGVHGCRGACVAARGACMVVGGHAWLRGVCVVAGACMVLGACMVVGGCVWLLGGVRGCWGDAWFWGGMCGCGGHAWWAGCAWLRGSIHRIRRDTVNERAVLILLECILVLSNFSIDFEITRGQLVAVVGHVGSGKSSLIGSLLGESTKLNGRVVVNVRGRFVCFVSLLWVFSFVLFFFRFIWLRKVINRI